MSRERGDLIIIGGHEEKNSQRQRKILQMVAARAKRRNGHLLIATVATSQPEDVAREYRDQFRELGAGATQVLDIRSRDDAYLEENVALMRGAGVVFLTGGDQLRITSQMADSPVYQCLQQRYLEGLLVAGTSAGAAVMPKTMLIGGPSNASNIIEGLDMAPGLGLIDGVIIDSHFAERGRIARLVGAVARNPSQIGIGIDENTAIIVREGAHFTVLGSGAVYVVDGAGIMYSSVSEERPEGVQSIFGVRLHLLAENDCYDLVRKTPVRPEG